MAERAALPRMRSLADQRDASTGSDGGFSQHRRTFPSGVRSHGHEMTVPAATVQTKIGELLDGLLRDDGFGELRVEVRQLKRGQKEVIVHRGKQFRYVVDSRPGAVEGRANTASASRTRPFAGTSSPIR